MPVSIEEALGLEPEPLGTVILCEGKKWEIEVTVPRPVGRRWINRYGKLASFVMGFANEMDIEIELPSEGDGEVEIKNKDVLTNQIRLMEVISKYFDKDEFMDDFVPAVFGLEDRQGRQYIEKFVDATNVINPFMQAAMMIITNHEQEPAVVEAKKKSRPVNGKREPEPELTI